MLLEVLGALGGLAVADVTLAAIFGRMYRNERRPDVVRYFTTEDGWTLALHQYNPPAGVALERPVIVCHGLSGNHHGSDLTARTSLVRFLAAAGHPTFAVDLRGAGDSDKGGIGRGRPLNWKLSHHYKYDAPAAIDEVRRLTGADKVHWIGHSMGGMVAYAFLQSPVAAKISRCVILASPATFQYMRPVHKFAFLLKPLTSFEVPLETLARSGAPLMEWSKLLQMISGNQELLPGHGALEAANCQSQTPASLLLDFTRFIAAGRYVGDDGTDLLEGMRRISTPTLFMVGAHDKTAAWGAIQSAYDHFGSSEKKLIVLGRKHGHKGDYGHMTILIGPHVYDEVFPHITAWLTAG
jgi:pimeloyl-ACP methyl ester carboxylesterase